MSFTSLSTGGKYSETLTINQIPSHSHSLDRFYQSSTSAHKHQGSGGVSDGVNPCQGKNTLDTYSTGENESHNNMPPYIAVYMWKRTA